MDKKEEFPIRDRITILPADDPNKKRLGYKMIEIPIGVDLKEFLKKIFQKKILRNGNKNFRKKILKSRN